MFAPDGAEIGRTLPERRANVGFIGQKRNRLFIAAGQSLYALYVDTQKAPAGRDQAGYSAAEALDQASLADGRPLTSAAQRSPPWTAPAIRGILSWMGRPTRHVYEVSAPGGEVLGLVRASSAARALRRINELCGVPCTVLGRQVFFAEEHRHDCAGRWQVRIVRMSVKTANLMTRSYVADGPAAVFVASAAHARNRRPAAPRLADDHARPRRSLDDVHPPISG